MADKNPPPANKMKLYDHLIAQVSEIKRKGGTMPYTSLNGNMFTFLDKEGFMGLRLDKEQREDFINKYGTELMVQYGAVMKEYVKVPDKLLADTSTMKKYLIKSLEYARTLKPKPTKSGA